MKKYILHLAFVLLSTGCAHLTASGECESELKSFNSRFRNMNECLAYKEHERAMIFGSAHNNLQQQQRYNRQQMQSMQQPQAAKTIDTNCVNICLNSGSSYPLCESKCSY